MSSLLPFQNAIAEIVLQIQKYFQKRSKNASMSQISTTIFAPSAQLKDDSKVYCR
jgi:hypothetical protein